MRNIVKVALGMIIFLLWVADRPGFSASKPTWEEVVAAAEKEGKVTLLGPRRGGVRPSLIKNFKKAFPKITLEYQGGNFGALIPRLRAELPKGKTSIDLVIGGASSILRNKDLMEPIPPRLVLSRAIDPNKWRSSTGRGIKWNDRERQFSLQTSEWIFGYIVVNTKLADPSSLNSWRDLLKPKWKGKIAFHDPRGSGAGQEIASYLLVKLGEKYIVDLFKGQETVLTRSYSQIADWLAQRKYAIGIAQTSTRIEKLKKEGVPLKAFSLPDAPGTITGGFSVIGIVKGLPHPNAATVFLNWLLTREGQEALHRPQLYPSLRTDVPRDFVPQYGLPKPGIEYLDTYGEDFVAIRDKLGKQVRDLLGR